MHCFYPQKFSKTIQTACSSAGSWPWARGAQAAGGPLGTQPPLAGVTQRSPFFCCCQSARPEKKDLFPLREVARIGNIKTRASQISVDKGTEPSFLQTHHCWSGGGGSHPGDCGCSMAGLGPGVGGLLPPTLSSSGQLCTHGWYRGALTRRHQHSRVDSPGKLCTISWSERIKGSLNEGGVKLC